MNAYLVVCVAHRHEGHNHKTDTGQWWGITNSIEEAEGLAMRRWLECNPAKDNWYSHSVFGVEIPENIKEFIRKEDR